ncbi:MAG: hypothetical protein JWP52_1988 [Rhizobacter sp.]|nr:hypothetical protein [Rhizobacter sp.]
MSYILEALKRADAERDRGALPTLRSPGPGLAADVEPVAGGKPWLWLLVGLLIAVIAMLVWRQWAPGVAPAPVVATAPQAPANPPPPAATVADSVTTSPPAGSSAVVPPKEAAANAAPSRTPPATRAPAATAPPAAATKRPAVPPASTESSRTTARVQPQTGDDGEPTTPPRRGSAKASPSPATTPPPTTPPKPAEPATPPARIYAVSELPEDIRRSLPKLAIGGSVYSESAGSRMLIVNGQIFHESDTLIPGLKLEQIRLKEAVMNFRGYRYEVSY